MSQINSHKRAFLKNCLIAAAASFTGNVNAITKPSAYRDSFSHDLHEHIKRSNNLQKKYSHSTIFKFISDIESQTHVRPGEIQRLISTDYDRGHTDIVNGFILSHTEIKIYLSHVLLS